MIKNISFIIPAKDEYENLKKLIPYLIKFSENKNYLYQIIVVQGVDTNIDTNLLCKKFNLEIINRKHETFKDALILGIEKSEYETLVTLDADLSHNIGDLQNGLEIFNKEDCDLVLFSRHMHDSSFKERYINFIFSKITNYFLRVISKLKLMIIQIISGFIKNHFLNMLNLIQRILKFYSKLYIDSTDLMKTSKL